MVLFICYSLSFCFALVVCLGQNINLDPNIIIYNLYSPQVVEHKNYSQVILFVHTTMDIFSVLNIWNKMPSYFYEVLPYVRFGLVDCTTDKEMCEVTYRLFYTPVIIYFPPYSKLDTGGIHLPFENNMLSNVNMLRAQLQMDARMGAIRIPMQSMINVMTKLVFEPTFHITFSYGTNDDFSPPPPPPPPSQNCEEITHIQQISVDHVTLSNIDLVLGVGRVVIMVFYDMKCVTCQDFKSTVEQFHTEFKEYSHAFAVVAVDCSTETDLCDSYSLSYYPSLRYFPEDSNLNFTGIELLPRSNYPLTEGNVFKEIMSQQSLGKAEILPSIIPFIEDDLRYVVNEPGSRGILLIEDDEEPLIGPKFIFKFHGKRIVKFAAGNEDLDIAFEMEEKPILMFIYVNVNKQIHIRVEKISKDINKIEEIINNFYVHEVYDQMLT